MWSPKYLSWWVYIANIAPTILRLIGQVKLTILVKSLSECILSGVVFLDDLDVILIHADL